MIDSNSILILIKQVMKQYSFRQLSEKSSIFDRTFDFLRPESWSKERQFYRM